MDNLNEYFEQQKRTTRKVSGWTIIVCLIALAITLTTFI